MNALSVAALGLALLAVAPDSRPCTFRHPGTQHPTEAEFARQRQHLVDELRHQGIEDERVLDAIARVPRHEFVDLAVRDRAYDNRPLPIGHGQTISQPYIVALMTELLAVGPGDRVLEIGTGSGYQTAVLAQLGCSVFTVEIVPELAERAARTFSRLQIPGVHQRVGDGYLGWTEHAPFDAVIVTAAPPEVPDPLVEQLRIGGRLVVPLGEPDSTQMLTLLEKGARGELTTKRVIPVRFVPLVHPGSN